MSGIVAATLHAPLPELLLDITGKVAPNLPALLSAAGWLGTAQPVRVRNTGIVGALEFTSALAGARIVLLNTPGAIIGGTSYTVAAVKTAIPIAVDNQGSLYGAGGDGGAGGNAWVSRGGVVMWAYGGAGGYGQRIQSSYGVATVFARGFGQAGQSVTNSTPRPGGDFGGSGPAYADGGTGGDGSNWGETGNSGGSSSVSGDYDSASGSQPGYAGTPAGLYIDGNSLVTWINTGTRLGGVKA